MPRQRASTPAPPSASTPAESGDLLELDDRSLLGKSVAAVPALGFLSEKSASQLKLWHENAEKAGSPAYLNTVKEVGDFWDLLLMDAIHALKLKDRREKAFKDKYILDPANGDSAREQNVFGMTELKRYFKAFAGFERVLYGAEHMYRDHVRHSIRVWLIGIHLLQESGGASALHFDAPIKNKGNKKAVKEAHALTGSERWAMWTVVALCHDLGYPLEKTHKVNANIDDMLSHFGNVSTSRYQYGFQPHHHWLNDLTLRIIASKVEQVTAPRGNEVEDVAKSGSYVIRLQSKYYAKLAHSFETMRHGIMSALLLMKTMVYFMETDYVLDGDGTLRLEDARQFYLRREMLRAIAGHTCNDIYHLRMNTLSFLLILADELQEWGRPTLGDMITGHVSEDTVVSVAESRLDLQRFTANVRYVDTGDETQKRVRNTFRMFHKLMRAAIEDSTREFDFAWTVEPGDYVYAYDAHKPPFQELSYTEGGKPSMGTLYSED